MKFWGKSQGNSEDLKRCGFAKEKPLYRRQDKKVVACISRSFLFGIFNSRTDFNLACYRKEELRCTTQLLDNFLDMAFVCRIKYS